MKTDVAQKTARDPVAFATSLNQQINELQQRRDDVAASEAQLLADVVSNPSKASELATVQATVMAIDAQLAKLSEQRQQIEPQRQQAAQEAALAEFDATNERFWRGIRDNVPSVDEASPTALRAWANQQNRLTRLRNAYAAIPDKDVLAVGVFESQRIQAAERFLTRINKVASAIESLLDDGLGVTHR